MALKADSTGCFCGTLSIPANKSRGLELIKNRVEVLNQLGYHIEITFIDPDEGGTIIQIKMG